MDGGHRVGLPTHEPAVGPIVPGSDDVPSMLTRWCWRSSGFTHCPANDCGVVGTTSTWNDMGMVIPLMLATLTDRRDFGDDWLLERKLDGERCVARKVGSDVRLESRSGKDLTSTYPEVRSAVAAQRPRELLLDGELVAFDGDQTSFARLQQRLGVNRPSAELVANYPVVYCVFDLLEVEGEDVAAEPLVQRRARLMRTVRVSTALQHTEAWSDESQRRFADACRLGWEGLIAKRADAPYTAGRSKNWLKLKCVWEQEFVIGGYTDPTGSRTDFGALLVGYYERVSSAMPGRSAPATPRRHSLTSARSCESCRLPSRRLSTLARSPAAHTGRGPCSSLRSDLPNGPATGGYDSHAFSGFATTRTRPRWCGNGPAEHGPGRRRPLAMPHADPLLPAPDIIGRPPGRPVSQGPVMSTPGDASVDGPPGPEAGTEEVEESREEVTGDRWQGDAAVRRLRVHEQIGAIAGHLPTLRQKERVVE